MQIAIETDGLEVDAALESYLRTTVAFATWWQDAPAPSRIRVALERAGEDAAGWVRCTLRAELPGSQTLQAGATGSEAWEAIQVAGDLLEVALWRPAPTPSAERERLAA